MTTWQEESAQKMKTYEEEREARIKAFRLLNAQKDADFKQWWEDYHAKHELNKKLSNPMPDPVEPDITINGIKLTSPQAMTVRVALESFYLHLQNDGLGNDAHGKAMVKGYTRNIKSLRPIIFLNQPLNT